MDKSEIEAERRHFVDATRQANYSFWSALLTVNGIFISVFVAAIFVVESDRRIMAILVVVSMQSCLLLIRSIRALRDFYEGLGPYVEGKAPTVDEERENYETVNKLRKSLKRREEWVIRLLVVQVVLIVILLVRAVCVVP